MSLIIKPFYTRNRLFILGLGLFVLVACTGTVPPQNAESVAEVPIVASPTLLVMSDNEPKQLDSDAPSSKNESDSSSIPTNTPDPDVAESVPPTPAPLPTEPAPVQAEFKPSDRPLGATDPTTFNLASGEVQLVEFFAYW
jgi:hypothetical protein